MRISDSKINLSANSYARSETASVKGEYSGSSVSSSSGNYDTASFSGQASYESDYVSYGDSVSYSTKGGKLRKDHEEESFSAVSESIIVTDDDTNADDASLTDVSSGRMYLNQESFKLLAGLMKSLKMYNLSGLPSGGLDITQMSKICIGMARLKSSSGKSSSSSASSSDVTSITSTKISSETTASSQTQGMDFNASGSILTSDGRQIDFSFDLSAISSSYDSSITDYSGALVYDKNGDGVISNKSELVGATSGNGFEDLAKYDDDGNGWIDEDDEIFDKLSVYVTDENGNGSLVSLKEYGVGAIFTGSVSTSYVTSSCSSVSRTGIYLREDGSVGAVNHINYKA